MQEGTGSGDVQSNAAAQAIMMMDEIDPLPANHAKNLEEVVEVRSLLLERG